MSVSVPTTLSSSVVLTFRLLCYLLYFFSSGRPRSTTTLPLSSLENLLERFFVPLLPFLFTLRDLSRFFLSPFLLFFFIFNIFSVFFCVIRDGDFVLIYFLKFIFNSEDIRKNLKHT